MIDPHALRRAFGALPERTRKVFWLHRVDDLSYAQIAALLGIAIEEVQTEIANALYGIDRLLKDAAPTDREPTAAGHGSRLRVYRRWCWRWRLRHWRSWFLAPVDHDDMEAHLEYVFRCMPRMTREIYIAVQVQNRTREQVRGITGLPDAAVHRHLRNAIRHIHGARRLRSCEWPSKDDRF